MRAPQAGIDRRTFLLLAAAGATTTALPAWFHRADARPTSDADIAPDSVLAGVAIHRGRLVAVGSDARGRAAGWSRGPDRGWTRASGLPGDAVVRDVAPWRGGFVAVGALDRAPAVWTSDAHGSTWRELTRVDGPGELTSAASAGATLIVGGARLDLDTGEPDGPLLAAIAPGGAWGSLTTEGLRFAHGSVTAVAHGNRRWVLAGTSTDGGGLWSVDHVSKRWVASGAPDVEPVVWTSLLPIGTELVAVGTTLASQEPRVARTADARSWSAGTVPELIAAVGADLRAVAVDLTTDLVTVAGLDHTLDQLLGEAL